MTAQSTARTCAVALRHSLDLRPVGSPLATYLCTYVIMPADATFWTRERPTTWLCTAPRDCGSKMARLHKAKPAGIAYRPGKASPSRSPAAGDRAARVERARGVRGLRARRGMGGALVSGRRAHSSVSFVRPGGSARRRSSESPSSGARLIGGDWAGRRAYHREGAPPAETSGGTAARLRDWHSACAARCNGAAGHSEGGVGRGRRRGLGGARGGCRAGRTLLGPILRRARRPFGPAS